VLEHRSYPIGHLIQCEHCVLVLATISHFHHVLEGLSNYNVAGARAALTAVPTPGSEARKQLVLEYHRGYQAITEGPNWLLTFSPRHFSSCTVWSLHMACAILVCWTRTTPIPGLEL